MTIRTPLAPKSMICPFLAIPLMISVNQTQLIGNVLKIAILIAKK